jgi:hypothetical protein
MLVHVIPSWPSWFKLKNNKNNLVHAGPTSEMIHIQKICTTFSSSTPTHPSTRVFFSTFNSLTPHELHSTAIFIRTHFHTLNAACDCSCLCAHANDDYVRRLRRRWWMLTMKSEKCLKWKLWSFFLFARNSFHCTCSFFLTRLLRVHSLTHTLE